jgi:HAD superfamily hydrolase (TIGR01484 family)
MSRPILATDLDRTLLPNGHWPADPQAIELFNELTRAHELLVVYVTGRNLALTEQAIEDYGVRHPDVLCGDVGTTIRRREAGAWRDDPGWEARVHEASPAWDAAAIRDAVAAISGIREQEPEHLNPFKQSYYVDHERREHVLTEVQRLVGGRYDEVAVYSFDSANGNGLLDFLPASATKQTALEYVAEAEGVPRGEVVFCGDSGNDVFPLTAGFRGVLVRNADEQLVAEVRSAMVRNPRLEAYFATGGYRGLSGYYTSGVLEGAWHYGLLPD